MAHNVLQSLSFYFFTHKLPFVPSKYSTSIEQQITTYILQITGNWSVISVADTWTTVEKTEGNTYVTNFSGPTAGGSITCFRRWDSGVGSKLGTLSNDADGGGRENITKKWICVLSNFIASIWNRRIRQISKKILHRKCFIIRTGYGQAS